MYQEEMLCVESMPQISLYHIPETGNWVVVYIFPLGLQHFLCKCQIDM